MNTNEITTLGGAVNVTIHKNYLKEDNSTYAKVQRTTAQMNNVIAAILEHSNSLDKPTLVAAAILFEEAILSLLKQGFSVNVFELGIIYPSAQGNIACAHPNLTDVPSLTLGFTPSTEALAAVAQADILMAKLEESAPAVSLIEDLSTHRTDCTVSAGKPVRITGRRLRIAGETEKTGLYLAPADSEGKTDSTESNWIKLPENSFFKNTFTYLELILPESLESGRTYKLIIRSAAGRGSAVNKTVRELIYEKLLTVN